MDDGTAAWVAYFRAVTGGESGKQVSARTSIPGSTISRWLTGASHPRPRQAVALARAYGAHPLPALIAAGYLTAEEAGVTAESPRRLQIREFSARELAEEQLRRVKEKFD